jgi:hypothetical protein
LSLQEFGGISATYLDCFEVLKFDEKTVHVKSTWHCRMKLL